MKKLSRGAARTLTDWLCVSGMLLIGAGGVLFRGHAALAVMLLGLLLCWIWIPIYAFLREKS